MKLGKGLVGILLFGAAGVAVLAAGVWYGVTQPIFSPAVPAASIPMDPAKLQRHVRMLSETFTPRDWTHPGNLDRVAAYIHNEFENAGAAVSEQPYVMEGNTYRNVIASFGPETRERIVVGAHYDAFGQLPGADDNASGAAGVIELAHLLGKTTLPMRVDLVAFTQEEPKTRGGSGLHRGPYGGSSVHAKSLKDQGVPVRLMLSLEMIGYFRDEPGSQRYPLPVFRLAYPSPGNYVLIVGRPREASITQSVKSLMKSASDLPVYSINAPALLPGVDWSDHLGYWKQGFPALMITDTAMNRNREYHSPKDTWDRLDYARMAKVVGGVYQAVIGTAAAPVEQK